MQFSILPEPDGPHAALLFSSSAGCCDSASRSTLSSCLAAVGSEGVGDVLCGRWAVIMPGSGLMSSLRGRFGHSDPFCLIGSSELWDSEEGSWAPGNWWRICRFKSSFICIEIVKVTYRVVRLYCAAWSPDSNMIQWIVGLNKPQKQTNTYT